MTIANAIGGTFDGFISALTSDGMYILYMLFSATGHSIWTIIDQLIYSFGTSTMITILLYFGFVIAPLITAIITGRLSENRMHSFVGFFFSVIICMLVSIILVYSGFAYQILIGGSLDQTQAIMNVVLGSLVNGVIYGLIAFITTKK